MVSRAVKKMQKKKAKEKDNRKKILANRQKRRAKAKEEREERRKEKRIARLQRDMEGLSVWEDEVLKKMPDKTLSQLEHNAKVLRALEEEHEKEMSKKRDINEGLEANGHLDLAEKLQVLHSKTLEEQKKKFGLTGSADCKMIAAPKPKKDTAIVEVLKAPKLEDTENS